jgi:flagellar motility protein MotE (MotC chaperone)
MTNDHTRHQLLMERLDTLNRNLQNIAATMEAIATFLDRINAQLENATSGDGIFVRVAQ